MTRETLFQFLSFAPGPFWLLILLFPAHRMAMRAVDAFLILLAGLFAFQTVPVIGELFPLLLKPDFDSLQGFLGSKNGLVASWNHMILGDLWIGRWVARDTLESRHGWIQRLVFLPPILFFGPCGLFVYLIFRIATRRSIALTA